MTPYIRCSPLNTVKIIKAFKFKTDFSLNITQTHMIYTLQQQH